MREYLRIGTIFVSEVGQPVFSELIRLVPEGLRGIAKHAFHMVIPGEDPRGAALTRVLHDAGWEPWLETWRTPVRGKEYGYSLFREYDPSDLGSCDYLELVPPQEARSHESIHRNIDGEIFVFEQTTSKDFEFFTGLSHWHFVTDRAREILEMSGLHHVRSRPTVFIPHETEYDPDLEMEIDVIIQPGPLQRSDPNGPIPYWEIDSDFTMPRLSPSMNLTDLDGRPIRSGEIAGGVYRREGAYCHPELRYRASDLERLEPFDLARTAEPFAFRRERDPLDCPLVASRRFYECCIANGLRAGWVPVRVDPD